jgi:cell division cycle protein 20 (cofactor of APC complex)
MQMNTTDVPIGNSVTYSKGMKVVFAVPDQGKIHTCDVWGKRKPDMKIRRQSSLDYVGIIR